MVQAYGDERPLSSYCVLKRRTAKALLLQSLECVMLMFAVTDPAQGDVELEVHFDDIGMSFLNDILRHAQSSGHEHVFEGSHRNALTIEENEAAPIRLVTFYYEAPAA